MPGRKPPFYAACKYFGRRDTFGWWRKNDLTMDPNKNVGVSAKFGIEFFMLCLLSLRSLSFLMS